MTDTATSEPKPPRRVVFDLDGTLIDRDSTALWLRGLIQASPAKRWRALAIAPVYLPMMAHPPLRPIAARAFFQVATRGLSEAALRASLAEFITEAVTTSRRLRWHREGLAALEAHLQAGDHVIVATGAPAWLAETLLAPWQGRLRIAGSILAPRGDTWTCTRHCRHEEKCRVLRELGFGERWDVAYSDSADDAPLLSRAARAIAVNADQRELARLRRRGVAHVEAVYWSRD